MSTPAISQTKPVSPTSNVVATPVAPPKVVVAPRGDTLVSAKASSSQAPSVASRLVSTVAAPFKAVLGLLFSPRQKTSVVAPAPKAPTVVAPVAPAAIAPSKIAEEKLPGMIKDILTQRLAAHFEVPRPINNKPSMAQEVLTIMFTPLLLAHAKAENLSSREEIEDLFLEAVTRFKEKTNTALKHSLPEIFQKWVDEANTVVRHLNNAQKHDVSTKEAKILEKLQQNEAFAEVTENFWNAQESSESTV